MASAGKAETRSFLELNYSLTLLSGTGALQIARLMGKSCGLLPWGHHLTWERPELALPGCCHAVKAGKGSQQWPFVLPRSQAGILKSRCLGGSRNHPSVPLQPSGCSKSPWQVALSSHGGPLCLCVIFAIGFQARCNHPGWSPSAQEPELIYILQNPLCQIM